MRVLRVRVRVPRVLTVMGGDSGEMHETRGRVRVQVWISYDYGKPHTVTIFVPALPRNMACQVVPF